MPATPIERRPPVDRCRDPAVEHDLRRGTERDAERVDRQCSPSLPGRNIVGDQRVRGCDAARLADAYAKAAQEKLPEPSGAPQSAVNPLHTARLAVSTQLRLVRSANQKSGIASVE